MSNYYCSGGCPLSTPKKEASATATKPKVTTVSENYATCTSAAVKEVKAEGKNDQVPPLCEAKIESKDDSAAMKEVKTEGKNDQVTPPGGAKLESKDAAAVQAKEK